jgi:hypothetical protein
MGEPCGQCFRTLEEEADLLGDFRAEPVLGLAAVIVQEFLAKPEGIVEQPYTQAMPTADFAGPPRRRAE